ncbi:DUF2933 domain-containing protein, partial [Limosilactobacillus fermentum]
MTKTYYRNKAKGSETMSQWILIALFLLAHPLMMLFMHKGMHGGWSSPKCWCKLNSANLSFHKLKHTGF